jgi:hypothetical protein
VVEQGSEPPLLGSADVARQAGPASAFPRLAQLHAGDRPHPAFAMFEVEAAVGTQGKCLSPILLDLGWHRRKWSSAGQYLQYWLPSARLKFASYGNCLRSSRAYPVEVEHHYIWARPLGSSPNGSYIW